MKFRPCIDIHNGKVKQIVGGSLKDAGDYAKENFVSEYDAKWYAGLYESMGLKGGHIILLNGKDSPYYEETKKQAISALSAWPGGLMVGGGINPENASEFLDAGASHVIVTSYVFKDGRIHYDRLNKMISSVGRERLVLDLSCRARVSDSADLIALNRNNESHDLFSLEEGRSSKEISSVINDELSLDQSQTVQNPFKKYYIVTDRWQKFTEEELTEELLEKLSACCDEFLVHAVDVEGIAGGIEERVVSLLSKEGLPPVTYAGGVGSLKDVEKIKKLGKNRVDVTIGSALDLFGGKLRFEDVLDVIKDGSL